MASLYCCPLVYVTPLAVQLLVLAPEDVVVELCTTDEDAVVVTWTAEALDDALEDVVVELWATGEDVVVVT